MSDNNVPDIGTTSKTLVRSTSLVDMPMLYNDVGSMSGTDVKTTSKTHWI